MNQYYEVLSSFVFNFNLRRYIKAQAALVLQAQKPGTSMLADGGQEDAYVLA